MAGIITKEDARHPSHPEYGKILKDREALAAKQAAQKKAADEKAVADKAAADKLAAEKKAADENKGK